LPLGMLYRLLDKDRLQQRIADFDVNKKYNVILLVLAKSPSEELHAKQLLLFAQQQPLPSRQAALHNVVRNLKVNYCYKSAAVFFSACMCSLQPLQYEHRAVNGLGENSCRCIHLSCCTPCSQNGGPAANQCAYFSWTDNDVQAMGVRFMPLAGRRTAAVVCQIVRARQSTSACSTPEEMEVTAEMSQCPAACFLAHELSPKEIALLQGKACSAYGFCLR